MHRLFVLCAVVALCGIAQYAEAARVGPSRHIRKIDERPPPGLLPDDIPLPHNKLIVDPPSKYQRYRRSEVSADKPFFQWWFFWVKDHQLNRHFAFCYALSTSAKGKVGTYDGAYFSMAMVDNSANATVSHLSKYERYNVSDVTITNDYDVSVSFDGTDSLFHLHVIDDNTLQLTGTLNHTGQTWFADNVDNSTVMSWNLTSKRVHGWYGQEGFELPDKIWGDIQWNTYNHDALVSGELTIGNDVYTIDQSDPGRFRLYGDMNWGEQFPREPKSDPNPVDRSYHWGWYYAGVPGTDPTQDISLIGGVGRTAVAFPFYTMAADFGNLVVGNTTNIGLLQVGFWETSKLPVNFEQTNDGKVLSWTTTQSDWVQYQDSLGNASLPLNQVVNAETTNHKLTMTFTSKISNYNRLLFPFQDDIFSDFEALGCDVTVLMINKQDGSAVANFTNNSGGLEFGYHVPVTFPPPV